MEGRNSFSINTGPEAEKAVTLMDIRESANC